MDIDKLMKFEAGEMNAQEQVEFFITLLNTRMVNVLNGCYRRYADSMIGAGWIVKKDGIYVAGKDLTEQK